MSDPITALARLLDQAPGAEPEVLESLGPPQGGAGDEALDFLFRRLQALYRDAVDEVAARWGEPAFDGTVEEDDFPPWADALVAAVWRRGGAVAFLALRHEDEAGPLTLEAVALTREEIDGMAVMPAGVGDDDEDDDDEDDGDEDDGDDDY